MASHSSAASSSTRPSSSTPFHRAFIYLPDVKAYSKPHLAWFSMSSNLRWLYFKSDNDAPPKSFFEFRGRFCLTLNRLELDAEWANVEDAIRVYSLDGKPAISVLGTFSRRLRTICSSRYVRVVILAEKVQERDAWANFLRNRVAPWQLLNRRTKEQLLDSRLSLAELECLFNWVENVPKTAKNAERSDQKEEYGPGSEACFVFDGINSVSNLVETIAVCVRTCAPVVKESAELIGDAAKCVTVVGAAFQGVALLATVVELSTEKKRGMEELPRIRAKLESLQGALVKSMIPILHPDYQVNEVMVCQMFRVQEEVASILCEVESQMMRRGVIGLLKSGELRTIERAMETLEDRVVDVVQSAEIAQNKGAITILSNEFEDLKVEVNPGVAVLRERPCLTSFFVGRQEEIDQLKAMLDVYGSAAIMQIGGAGKTQLMIAFADKALRNDWITGECYWVQANGKKRDFIKRLGNFAEALTRTRLKSEEREDVNAIVTVIRRKMRSLTGKWLICVDNADDPSVNGIVGELCRIADPDITTGWVLVTTRQGGVPMWSDMEDGQKLKLMPLSVEDAKHVLVRRKIGRRKTKVGESEVSMEIERMRSEDREEYNALCELAGDGKKHGLGGLALALAQAGSYISRKGVSFKEYVQFYKRVRQDVKMMRLFREVEDSGFASEEQRNVWTTWKINVRGLSDIAQHVLRAFAFLHAMPTQELLVKHLDKEFLSDNPKYLEYVLEELVNGASLLDCEESEGGVMFHMHHLVREFVQFDTRSDGTQYLSVIKRAVCGVNGFVRSRLLEVGNCVNDLPLLWPSEFSSGFRYHIFSCAKELVEDFTNSLFLFSEDSWANEVAFLYRFAIRCSISKELFNEDFQALCESFMLRLEFAYCSEADHVHVAADLYDKGLLELKTGRVCGAEKLFTRSIEMMQRLLGETCDNKEVAASLFQLGRIAEESKNITEAERCYRSSLTMKQRLHQDDAVSWDIAYTLFSLAKVLLIKDDREEAACLFKESHTMRQKLGRRFPSLNRNLRTLYDVFCHTSDIEGCFDLRSFVPECLNLVNLPEIDNHSNCIDVAILFQKVALMCLRSGEEEDAKRLFLAALDNYGKISMRKDGSPFHQHLASLADDSFSAYLFQCQMYDDCLRVCHLLYGGFVDHWGFSNILLDMARSPNSDNREEYCRESLSMKQRLLGNETDDPSISWALYLLGDELMNKGELEEAENLLQESLAMDRRLCTNSNDSTSVAMTMYRLAEVHIRKRDFVKSKSLCCARSEMLTRMGLVDHDDLPEQLYVLGTKATGARDFKFAEHTLRECAELLRSKNRLLDTAVLLQSLSRCLLQSGRDDEASSTFREVLKLYELERSTFEGLWRRKSTIQIYPLEFFILWQRLYSNKDHISVAIMLHYHATKLKEEGDLGKAEQEYRSSLAMKRRLGFKNGDYSSIALTLRELAGMIRDKKQYAESEKLYRECLAIDRRSYGYDADNSNIADALLGLAKTLLRKGDYNESEQLFKNSLSMKERLNIFDMYFYKYNDALLDIAFEMADEFAFDGAERLLLSALTNARSLYPHDEHNKNVVIVTNGLGLVRFKKGRYREAEKSLMESLKTARNIDSPSIADALFRLGDVTFELDRLEDAKQFYQKSLDMTVRLEDGCDSEKAAYVLSKQAKVALKMGDLALAEELCSESLAMWQRLFDDDECSETFTGVLLVQARISLADGSYGEVEKLGRKSLQLSQQIFGENARHPTMAEAIHVLAQGYYKRGELGVGVNLGKRSLEMYRSMYNCCPEHPHLIRVQQDCEEWERATMLLLSYSLWRCATTCIHSSS